jgi:hypothetical protein
MRSWTEWKRFPNVGVDAPGGPGLYEVRHIESGHLIAFGHCKSVAGAIGKMLPTNSRSWTKMFSRAPLISLEKLEYRTCATASHSEAKFAAARLAGLRQQYWRRRMALGIATYHSLREQKFGDPPSAVVARR